MAESGFEFQEQNTEKVSGMEVLMIQYPSCTRMTANCNVLK